VLLFPAMRSLPGAEQELEENEAAPEEAVQG
jgi:hypothetical protein